MLKKGYVFFAKIKPNKILLERRPSEGILGGLLGFPTSSWNIKKDLPMVPFEANWTFTNKVVIHQFTHFKLELEIATAELENPKFDTSRYLTIDNENFDIMALPTLMRKVYSKANSL